MVCSVACSSVRVDGCRGEWGRGGVGKRQRGRAGGHVGGRYCSYGE
jgi:hypothetical protein